MASTSLAVIRTLTIRAKTEGVDEAASSLGKLSGEQEKVAKSSTTMERATASAEKSFQRFERSIDPAARAQAKLADAARQLQRAQDAGLITQSRAGDLMQLAIRQHNSAGAAAKTHSQALQELSSVSQNLSGNLGTIGGVLSRLGPGGLAAAAALGGLALGFKQVADAALAMGQRAGALRDLSETIGFSVEQLQAFQIAAGRTGVSSEQLGTNLEKFSASLSEIREQEGKGFEALQKINPALALQAATADTAAESLQAISEALREATLEDANFASKSIFGRGGVAMVRVIKEMEGGLESFTAEQRRSITVTEEQSQKWDDLSDSISENFRIAGEALSSIFTGEVLQIIEGMSEAFRDLSLAAAEVDWSVVANGLQTVLNVAIKLSPILNAMASAFRLITSVLPSATDALEAFTAASGSPAGLPSGGPAEPTATGSPAGLPNAKALEDLAKGHEKAGRAAKSHKEEVEKLNPVISELSSIAGNLAGTLVNAFLRGENAAKALKSALQGVAASAADKAITSLIRQDFTGAAISGGIALTAAVPSKLFGGDEDEAVAKSTGQQNTSNRSIKLANDNRKTNDVGNQRLQAA